MRTTLPILFCTMLISTVWGQQVPGLGVTSSEGLAVSRAGSRAISPGSPKFFTGSVKVEQLFPAESPSRVSGGTVTFAPGARSFWHTHPYGQILLITTGNGRVQMEGHPIQDVHAGDVVRIPAGVKHWHGAAPNSSMTHIAIQDNKDGAAVDWLEPVSDQQYNGGK